MGSSFWNPNIRRLPCPGFRVEITEKSEPISADSQASIPWRGNVPEVFKTIYRPGMVAHAYDLSKGRRISVISRPSWFTY